MKKFQFLEHTADIKFRAFGKTLSDLYKNNALALFEVFYDKNVKGKENYNINVKGKDYESLLYNFLEEFLFLFDSKNFLPSKIISFKLDEKKLKITAEVSGDQIKNYNVNTHVKAVTYNEMFIKKQRSSWISQVVLDI
ncbi:archease [Patescibacteria group bacterium]|nr:archease [Patescibacteria group bacterium]